MGAWGGTCFLGCNCMVWMSDLTFTNKKNSFWNKITQTLLFALCSFWCNLWTGSGWKGVTRNWLRAKWPRGEWWRKFAQRFTTKAFIPQWLPASYSHSLTHSLTRCAFRHFFDSRVFASPLLVSVCPFFPPPTSPSATLENLTLTLSLLCALSKIFSPITYLH